MPESDVKNGTSLSSAVYSNEEVIQRFEVALETLDLNDEIALIGHGLGSLLKRGKAWRELYVICIVMWRLSLESSFPDQQEDIFRQFQKSSHILGRGGKRKKLIERANMYWGLLESKKSADFTPLAVYMAGEFSSNLENRKALQLKLTLSMRRIYKYVFDGLI